MSESEISYPIAGLWVVKDKSMKLHVSFIDLSVITHYPAIVTWG
jgi:hypothetical protein